MAHEYCTRHAPRSRGLCASLVSLESEVSHDMVCIDRPKFRNSPCDKMPQFTIGRERVLSGAVPIPGARGWVEERELTLRDKGRLMDVVGYISSRIRALLFRYSSGEIRPWSRRESSSRRRAAARTPRAREGRS